jgi:hypothetical protein
MLPYFNVPLEGHDRFDCNLCEMHCEGKLKLTSHNTVYCSIEVVTIAGLTVLRYIHQVMEKAHITFGKVS